MPFKSKKQMRKCYALKAQGKNGSWNCDEWAHAQNGGDTKLSYNPTLAADDKAFQEWYKLNTIEGKNNIPYSENLDYDYYSYYKNGDYKDYQGGHFPDIYKRPNHKTFSIESIYSTPENTGGSWQGDTFIPPQNNNMKKKSKKFQFAGSTDPCGPGTQWDANSMQCVPVPTNPNVDPIFQNNYNGDFTGFNPSAFALGNGKVISGDTIPLHNISQTATPNYQFDASAGAKDARGNFIPYQEVVPDAIDKGFNYDSDGVYRKTVEKTNNNILGYSDPFKALNLGLNLTQGIAGVFNDAKTKKQEKYNLLKARYNRAYYNPYEQGLNNVPAYFKTGGSIEINPKHKGLFTKEAKAAGMSVQEFAKHVLANKDKYSPEVVKRANFANNFAHQNGGSLPNYLYKDKDGKLNVNVDKLPNTNKFDDTRQWMQNWINNRPKQFANFAENQYRSDHPFLQLFGVNDNDKKETIASMKNTAISNLKNVEVKDGSVIPGDAYVPLVGGEYSRFSHNIFFPTGIADKDLAAHEFGHASGLASTSAINDYIHNTIKDDSKYKSNYDGYYNSPEEIYSRIWALRKKYNLQPNQKVTPEFLKQKYNEDQKSFFEPDEIYDHLNIDTITNLLNGLVTNDKSNINNTAQNGGYVNNTGYLPQFKTSQNPYNIIPSNDITMNGVPQDLLAIPNVGKPQVMPANSGKYKFPNATHVTEIPLAKNGGSFSIGSHVGWNSEAGHVTGTITKKHTKPFKVNGYTKHASKEKPVYEIKSSKTDHIAYHFGDALHKLQNGGYHDYDCPNGDCYDNAAIKLPIPEFLQVDPSKRFLRQAKRDEQRYIESGQYLIDRAGFYKNNTNYGKYPIINWDPQPQKNGVIDYGINNFTPTGSNAELPSDRLYAQTGGYVTPKNMEDWNSFITYAQQQGLAGSSQLDVRDKNLGQDLLNRYVKANPQTSLNYELVPKIQQELQYYRQQILDRIAKGGGALANGATPENFMSGLSKVDGWLGSRTTSYMFPSAYMHNNNTNTTQPLGLAATSNLQKGGKAGEFQYGGLDEVDSQPDGNAEVEEGEVIQQNSGKIVKAAEGSGTHEEGGNIQPDVSRVLEDTADKRKDKNSKLLRITPQEAYDIVGFKPKTTVTHSKLFEQSTEFYNKKLHTFEKKLNDNLQYIKNNGGQYAENSLEQNLKLLSNYPTEAELFDKIYNHQESVKNIHGIMDNPDKKVGGFVPKFQNGSSKSNAIKLDDPKGWEFIGQEGNKKYYRKKGTSEVKTFTDYDVVDTKHKAAFTVDDILNHPEQFSTFANNMEGAPDDVKRKAAEDLFYHGIMPRQYTKTLTTPDQYGYMDLPAQPGVNNRPQVGTRYNTPGGSNASEFNMPLHWYDVAGNVANYLSSSERIPVSFEQLDREPLRVHELNPQPALDANTGDFNAAMAELPNNGVGFANQANLLANKYKVNNEIVGQYANQNAVRADQVDAANNANKFQLDQINLNLRDRAVNQQLQGMEVERQSKLNAFDDYLTKLAQNSAFNRNGNLILQLTPYFNQEGKFNGNQYIFRDNGNGNAEVVDKKTGKVVKTITQDGFGATKQVKTYIRQ